MLINPDITGEEINAIRDAFENRLVGLLSAVKNSCKKVFPEEDARYAELQTIYRYDTIDEFRLALVEWLDSLRLSLTSEMEGSRSRAKMEEALAYIQGHYNDGLNMAVVCDQLSMNYSVFSQMFKEYTGQNFVDYLRDLRIAKAKELLLETSIRISDVGEQVGYENDKHFMKAFKTAVGVSPTEYRKRTVRESG